MRRRWLDRVPRPDLDKRDRQQPPAEDELVEDLVDEESALPTVLHVPIRCKRCGSTRKRTTGVRWQGSGTRRRRVRYHLCREHGCGLRYRSVEVPWPGGDNGTGSS